MYMDSEVKIKEADDGTYIVSCRDNSPRKENMGGPCLENREKMFTASNMDEVMDIVKDYFTDAEKHSKEKKFDKGREKAEKE